ncbi:MAG TPA: RHS repeat-associated core domain-containing protein [Candidatus Limnocylindrales bacterium]
MLKRALTALLMAASGLVAVADRPGGLLPDDEVPQIPWTGSSTGVAVSQNVGGTPEKFAFPAARRWRATVGGVAPVGAPVRVMGKAGGQVDLEVLDRAAAQRARVSGFVFKTSKVDGPMTLSVDYSSFANAYGGNYADRLQLVALPACLREWVQSEIESVGCSGAGTRLPATNDVQAGTLTAEVSGLDGATVFAVTSGLSGEQGTWAATQLSPSGSWQVAPGSGAFSYGYPIDVPKPGVGSAPSVSTGYSSAAIDGMTMASNTQASPMGVGWSDFANAYIERRYEQCYRIHLQDLCWQSDNAVLSLNGVFGTLVPVNSPANTEWKLQSDPGWRITRNGNAQYTDIHGKQSWEVTGPDGTRYVFGGGHMPGRQTNSILSVGVLADDTGEPCRGANDTVGGCIQGWRWYLDRVIDPDGNETAFIYERETNYFSAIRGLGGTSQYHRGAVLKEIIYGGRNWDSATYSARVLFDTEERCLYLVPNCPAAAPGPGGFYDVPTDLLCNANTCGVFSPSFFTSKRYSFVRTEVRIGGAWKPAAKYKIVHEFGDGTEGVGRKLRVRQIQRIGDAFDKETPFPPTTFGYKWFDNRNDHDGNIPKAMRHVRLNTITNPFGGVTTVTYGQARPCEEDYAPPSSDPIPRWDQNVLDCFPQEVKDNDFTGTGVYNKYLVTSVAENDGFSTTTTSYSYLGDPAWAFDFSAFERDQAKVGWSSWRGYGEVDIRKGTSWQRLKLLRGLNRDHVIVKVGSAWTLGDRHWSVTASDGTVVVDDSALGGRVLEEQQFGTVDGVGASVVDKRIHRYEVRVLDPLPGWRFPIQWVGLAGTTESVAVANGLFHHRRSTTIHNAHFQPTSTWEEGWLHVSGDERCSITTYAEDAARNMFVYPAVNKKVAGNCDSANVLTESQTLYDNSTTLGVLGAAANPTAQRVRLDASSWSQTTTEYDTLGRPVKATDPTGVAVTTTYAVSAGGAATEIPFRTTMTNALGHQQITDYQIEFGTPKREQDANGNVTTTEFDEFGRSVSVWLPTEVAGSPNRSWQFSYDLPNRAIRARQLVTCCTSIVYEDSWTVYDGMWRERQSQNLSPVSGKVLVSEKTYDNRGLLRDEMVEQAFTGTPGKYLNGGTAWLNRTRHSYDELGREVLLEWLRGETPAHATRTAFTADMVTATGPGPNPRQVRQRIDGLGRTIAVEEAEGSAWATSRYGYDLADRMVSVTDPAGNKVEYIYNMAGWRIGQVDPNRGGGLFGYDLAGRQTVAYSDSGLLVTSYDALGRPLERRADSATGPLLASWQYDTAIKGKGKLHREINGSGWVSEVTGYDPRGRVTGNRLVVPQGIPGLSGSYTVDTTYDLADRVRTLQLPAIGGLLPEKVTAEYSNLGLPTRLFGLEEYVSAVGYDDRGRRISAGLGPKTPAQWMTKHWTFDVDQRINGTRTLVNNAVVAEHRMVFTDSGNLGEKLTTQSGMAWRECFTYDQRSRLTVAHTVASSTTCAAGTPGTGDRPYRHAYQYSPDGKLLARIEDGVTTSYTYPAAGAARPHAPTRVGADTYSWDTEGKLVSRTVSGQASPIVETFGWDKQDRLTSVTGPSGATSFVYDPSGQRLLRRTPDGRATLYFAGHEITVNSGGGAVSSVRQYTLDGSLVATRTLSGVEYAVSDPAGSLEMTYPSGGSAPATSRAYLPYGRVRAETGDTATDRGFIGQIEDASTKLSYLNDRYYDTRVGVFISADAVFNTSETKTLNPYTYASGNPTTLSDPSGFYSAGAFGLELQNANLRAINKELVSHIKWLNHQIAGLQDVIREQNERITKMAKYIGALEAEIARQERIIRRLEAKVAQLQRIVAWQAREIGRLKYEIRVRDRIIKEATRVIGYYQGVVNYMGMRLWGGNPFHGMIMASIHSGRGIPFIGLLFDNVSVGAADLKQMTQQHAKARWRIEGMKTEMGELEEDLAWQREYIGDLSAYIKELRQDVEKAGRTGPKDWLMSGLSLFGKGGMAITIANLYFDVYCDTGAADNWTGGQVPLPTGGGTNFAHCSELGR